MGKTSAHKPGHGPYKISGGLDNLELVYFWGSEFLGATRFSQWPLVHFGLKVIT